MRFTTVSGSTYEVEYPDNAGGTVLVRRLGNSGGHASTQRVGEDGKWQTAIAIHPAEPLAGLPVLIHWKMNEDGSMNCTQTSKVSKVEH